MREREREREGQLNLTFALKFEQWGAEFCPTNLKTCQTKISLANFTDYDFLLRRMQLKETMFNSTDTLMLVSLFC